MIGEGGEGGGSMSSIQVMDINNDLVLVLVCPTIQTTKNTMENPHKTWKHRKNAAYQKKVNCVGGLCQCVDDQ